VSVVSADITISGKLFHTFTYIYKLVKCTHLIKRAGHLVKSSD